MQEPVLSFNALSQTASFSHSAVFGACRMGCLYAAFMVPCASASVRPFVGAATDSAQRGHFANMTCERTCDLRPRNWHAVVRKSARRESRRVRAGVADV